jgi:hypothetical protein
MVEIHIYRPILSFSDRHRSDTTSFLCSVHDYAPKQLVMTEILLCVCVCVFLLPGKEINCFLERPRTPTCSGKCRLTELTRKLSGWPIPVCPQCHLPLLSYELRSTAVVIMNSFVYRSTRYSARRLISLSSITVNISETTGFAKLL